MRPTLIALTALLLACAVFVAASGLLGTAVSLRTAEIGYSGALIGLIMGAYFAGYIAGTWLCPNIVSRVAHIRAFAVFAASASVAVLAHALFGGVIAWMTLRFITGVCIVGLYMIVESWLNEKSANEHRGRVFAIYQLVSLGSLAIGQWLLLINTIPPATPFVIAGALLALGLLPVALTRIQEPAPLPKARLDFRRLWTVSPLACLGSAAVAIANSAFFALGPLYAADAGMRTAQIALFMSLVVLGGAALQWPIGHLSDSRDRRKLILLVSAGAATTCVLITLTAPSVPGAFYALVFLYGGFTFTLYPLSVAHANDHIADDSRIHVAGGLLLLYGIGAAIGPPAIGLLVSEFGAEALFSVLAGVHGALCLSVLVRMRLRQAPLPSQQTEFVLLNRTSPSALAMLPDAEPASHDESRLADSTKVP